ncbi:nuclear transport factor 2 family protein [Paraburkholderia aspalathi]|uniref:SnoaL-like domain-containing protein n=1 Tax=Paraburkholderia aspalathi TaxID=1324617 RepID=A0A1I7ERP7_9BURK|nr:nuclear transport factor 2 family protein [Paraburkholderia aspalathi]SFU26563.1 SnoaL-like domain-containing protein [Paraburkholderia aspalathi]
MSANLDSTAITPTTLTLLVQTQHRFYRCLDRFDYDGLLAVTCDDLRWHRQGQWLIGHDALLATMHARPATQRVAHVITNTFIVESTVDECSTESYMTAYRFDDGSEHDGPVNIERPFRLDHVITRFRHTAQHGWRIAELVPTPVFQFSGAS